MSTKILVLGERLLITLFKNLLVDKGYLVEGTESETEAVSLLSTQHYDLLMLTNLIPDGTPSVDFLARWRSQTNNQDYPLVLMLESRTDSFYGIIRTPVYPYQAHGYMPFPIPVEDFPQWIEPLLGGLSTQKMPGDEGYTQYEHPLWNIAFEYPALWRKTDDLSISGPWHRNLRAGATIEIYRHLTHNPHSPYLMREVIDNSFGRFRKLRKITPDRQVQIAGLQAQEAEYLWEMESFTGLYSGRQIIATVNQEVVYGISFASAEDDFDDYRPVYSHLLETFTFLS